MNHSNIRTYKATFTGQRIDSRDHVNARFICWVAAPHAHNAVKLLERRYKNVKGLTLDHNAGSPRYGLEVITEGNTP